LGTTGLSVHNCVLSRSTGAAILIANAETTDDVARIVGNVLFANRAAVVTVAVGGTTPAVHVSGNRSLRVPSQRALVARVMSRHPVLSFDPCRYVADARAQSGDKGWEPHLSPGFLISRRRARPRKTNPINP